jgi:DnaJ-class molecular chaperone
MKPKDILLKLTIDVKDIYSGNIKKINYSRYLKGTKIKDHVYVDLKNFTESHVLEGYGDENPFTKKCGDLKINFIINYGSFNNVYINNIIDTYDMSYSIKISLYEFFYGFRNTYTFITIPFDISFHNPHVDGLSLTLPNLGLPYEDEHDTLLRGNLIILLDIDLSTIDTNTIEDKEFKRVVDKYFNNN